jgi:predicted NodU family carbamoyl transferase
VYAATTLNPAEFGLCARGNRSILGAPRIGRPQELKVKYRESFRCFMGTKLDHLVVGNSMLT